MTRPVVVVSLAALGAVIIALWYVGAAGGVQRAQTRGLGTIEVIAVTGRYEVPGPPRGRAGNGERLRWSIRDRFGRTIGAGILGCRWEMRQARLCTGELQFPLGKLAVVGVSATRSLGEWAVVGGTGRYHGASGAMEFRATGLRRLTLTINI